MQDLVKHVLEEEVALDEFGQDQGVKTINILQVHLEESSSSMGLIIHNPSTI